MPVDTVMGGNHNSDEDRDTQRQGPSLRETSKNPGNFSPNTTPSASNLPFIPTTATTSPENYGGLNPENEAVVSFLDGIPYPNCRHRHQPPQIDASNRRAGQIYHNDVQVKGIANSISINSSFAFCSYSSSQSLKVCFGDSSSSVCFSTGSKDKVITNLLLDTNLETMYTSRSRSDRNQAAMSHLQLLSLPPELIDSILFCLAPRDLVSLAATCKSLRQRALADLLWQTAVQTNVPGTTVRSPYPCSSFQELYAEHDRLWHLPKHKLWFGDREMTGKLILVRFDPRRGCIEGFQLLAVNRRTSFEHWAENEQVMIHCFDPVVRLHLDKPVLQFNVGDRNRNPSFHSRPGANRYADEMPMLLEERMNHMYSNFLLSKRLSPETADANLTGDYPYQHIWPPPAFPAQEHAAGTVATAQVGIVDAGDRPRHRAEVSDQTFHIRRWIQMSGTPVHPSMAVGQMGTFADATDLDGPDHHAESSMSMAAGTGSIGAHLGEEIMTYSTLDAALYTPTPTKPWRGIWVGDYSGHGCEFLLINQPDDPPVSDIELGLVRHAEETDSEWERRRVDARVYRGRLEAIKLTGDPNVPRGEYTFVADDLGPAGFVGTASQPPFAGARMVKSKGHIANTGFVRGEYLCSLSTTS